MHLKFLVCFDGVGLCEHLPSDDVISFNASKKGSDVIPCLAEIHTLLEHLHT